jgi:hypothetical protein
MIKFFRKIRHNLMEQNKTGKYLKYAIGEIILVVIGILIALSINNWNEEKAQQKIVHTYLLSFIEDLKDNISLFKEDKDHAVFNFNSQQYLLALAGEKPVANNDDDGIKVIPLTKENVYWPKEVPTSFNRQFVELAFLNTVRGITTEINRTSIDELKSTGTFSLIKNMELKNSINNYYSKVGWRIGERNQDNVFLIQNNWKESFFKDGILLQDLTNIEDPISLLKNNPERIGYLRGLIRFSWFKYVNMVELEQSANELIAMTEDYLNNN